MIGGPFRKCRKALPVAICFTILFMLLFYVVLWGVELVLEENRKAKSHVDRYEKRNNNVHVVVGHYIGPGKNNVPNASKEMMNTNNFHPEPQAGRDGSPVVIEPKDLLTMQQLFQINRFNLLASDRIPLNRTLPDVRRKRCQFLYKDYKAYPKSSVIIVFHNEAWSTLLRTVWSVINRSPRELVEEIILVDDASERDFLKKQLDDYVKQMPVRTTVHRLKERVGLVKARLEGAAISKGKVLIFLDAHCECTVGWLESLVARIAEDRTIVVCPVIDIINDDSFAYVKSFELHWGALNWNLQFRWYTLGGKELQKRKVDTTKPFYTPAMAGGLFAIDKSYFYEIGSYDEDMKIWGGENLEMSFRVWQCGGKIEIVPCSHVGHLFRKSSPYTFPGGIQKTLYSNLARVALVWMDDWANFYFRYSDAAREVKDTLNVTNRIELRKKLQCKNFEWYLDNVWPQHFFPKKDRFFGRIKNVGENKCLTKPSGKVTSNQPTGIAKITDCLAEDLPIDKFIMTKEGFIMTDDSICLDAPEKITEGLAKVRIMSCSGFSRQKWTYNKKEQQIIHKSNKLCLDVSPSPDFSEGLVITKCNPKSETQKWEMEAYNWMEYKKSKTK